MPSAGGRQPPKREQVAGKRLYGDSLYMSWWIYKENLDCFTYHIIMIIWVMAIGAVADKKGLTN